MGDFFLFPEAASTLASQVDALMLYVFLISAVFAAGIAIAIIVLSLKYHHGKKADRSSPPMNNLTVEFVWIGIPLVLVMTIFVWGSKLFIHARQAPANATDIYVVGKQWMWKLQHPEGMREINELHVPVGQPVKLLMTSQDVIHSFFIPAFRIKQDVLPGRYTSQWFEATRPGRYALFCAQFCGTAHSQMVGQVVAMTPIDYAQWLKSPDPQLGPAPQSAGVSMAVSGEQVAHRLACLTCHRPEGGGSAPTFVRLFGSKVEFADGTTAVADEAYLRDCILRPNRRQLKGYPPSMPSFQGQINEDELMQLIAYIKSLARGERKWGE